MASISQSLAVVAVAMFISGFGSQDRTSTWAMSDVARGEKLFVAHCALCHGIGGAGGRGPSLNHTQLRRAADNRSVCKVIQNGGDGTEMPGAW